MSEENTNILKTSLSHCVGIKLGLISKLKKNGLTVSNFQTCACLPGDSGSIIMTIIETQFNYRKDNIEYLEFIQRSYLVLQGFMDVCTFYKYTILSCTASKQKIGSQAFSDR